MIIGMEAVGTTVTDIVSSTTQTDYAKKAHMKLGLQIIGLATTAFFKSPNSRERIVPIYDSFLIV